MQQTRRQFIQTALAGASLVALAGTRALAQTATNNPAASPAADTGGPFTLPPLPYDVSALEPYISSRTLTLHHEKHHGGNVQTLNKLVKDTPYASQGVESIIRVSAGNPEQTAIFNNAAQMWSHEFFWHSMKPGGGGMPKGKLAEGINSAFGSFALFKERFIQAGVSHFGSGWLWLVADDKGQLMVVSTPNAHVPMLDNQAALLTTDLWEHSYYLDYQNRRQEYLTAFIDKLVNWDFAEENLGKG
jgi:Fe-Mn family superoxide dismutase